MSIPAFCGVYSEIRGGNIAVLAHSAKETDERQISHVKARRSVGQVRRLADTVATCFHSNSLLIATGPRSLSRCPWGFAVR